jgi:hypothetical protein
MIDARSNHLNHISQVSIDQSQAKAPIKSTETQVLIDALTLLALQDSADRGLAPAGIASIEAQIFPYSLEAFRNSRDLELNRSEK